MKKFIIGIIILFLILSAGIIYLNKVILPQKIKTLIISTIKEQTGKDATLKSVEFSLFRGLVIKDLVITDNQNVILSTRESSCSIFIWPIFKKQIIIPGITLKAPYVYIERRADQSFNLQDLFKPAPSKAKKSDFNLTVLSVNISGGEAVFQDNSLAEKLRKEIKNIQFNLSLGFTANLKFNFKGEVPGNPAVYISCSGQYKIPNQELLANLIIKNLSINEFKAYYSELGDLVSGLVNFTSQIRLKDQNLHANIIVDGDNLILKKDKFKAEFNSRLNSKINYSLKDKKLGFSGICDISEADLSGIDLIGEIKNLSGRVSFTDRSLIVDNLKAQLLGKQFEIRLGIKDFKTPVLNLNTDIDLSFLPDFLKKKFNFSFFNEASGQAALTIKAIPAKAGDWVIDGKLDIQDANLKLYAQDTAVENIRAKIDFSQDSIAWTDTKFKFNQAEYKTSGTLDNFSSPDIKLKLFSQDLSLATDFNLSGPKIKVNQFKGKYFDSQFLISGDINNIQTNTPLVDLGGQINLEAANLVRLFENKYPAIKMIMPGGKLDIQFSLNGNLRDFKNCYLKANLTSSDFSLYGLNTQNLSADLFQDQGIAKLSSLRFDFYGGTIQGDAAMNLNTPDNFYQLNLKVSRINLEKLKNDTPLKSKNIAGILEGEIKLGGYPADVNKLSGIGSFFISEGKLWELDLLQGIGKFLFAKDLGNITFSECSSEFLIKNKSVYTESLKLRSNIANLDGPLKIGFNNSLEGELDVEILSDMIPVSGTLKDLTTAVIGQAGKFGTIKLSGTLKDPKYDFKPAVSNIIKGITDIIFGGKKQ